ncbi:MAG: hypothetical protein KAI94_03185 [Anaerolineales bacterium]|nr:hypothetical protein [Anaerolineales bacterium]
MNIRLVPTQLEVYFWSTVITMMSESSFMQRCIRNVYHFKLTRKHSKLLLEALAWSIVGLLLGFTLGLLST